MRVGGDHPKTRSSERLDLSPPTEPELREAVQQNDQRPLTGLDVMQALIADLGIAVAKFDPDVRERAGGHGTSVYGGLGRESTPAVPRNRGGRLPSTLMGFES